MKDSYPISVVVGGRRGIGKVIVSHLRGIGHHVYTIGRENITHPDHIQCNIVSDFGKLGDKIKSLNYLIFAHRYRGSDWDSEFDVSVKGINNVFLSLEKNFIDDASVVIMNSIASHFVVEEQPAEYHASRAALTGLLRYYAVRYGENKIRFNCILPSRVIKPENRDFYNEQHDLTNLISKVTPLGRVGEANDIANLVEFLCSRKSSFVTGNCIFIDGGISLVGQDSLSKALVDFKETSEQRN